MTPILYGPEETSFTTNGIGFLSDMISCIVTEERNGIFEVEFEYPITGIYYEYIQEGAIIGCTHDEEKDVQPFRIYRRSATINGIVTFNARHIAYELQNVIIEPYESTNIGNALSGFTSHAMTDNPFTFWTDKTNNGTFKVTVPSSVWEKLGGSEGSILDAFGGGEWEFDKWTCKLYSSRGADNGVTIRYGKNLLDIENTVEDDGTYNAVIPYWQDPETLASTIGDLVVGSSVTQNLTYWTTHYGAIIRNEDDVPLEFSYFKLKAVPKDFTDQFESQPTKQQLNSAAATFLSNNRPWIPNQNISVDFVALWQTEEYESYALLQRVKLCDTVSVIYPELGVDAKTKVIRTVWNALLDRYDEIELGSARTSFAKLITEQATDEALSQVAADQTDIEAAIDHATALITGGLGGHVVIVQDANGKPTEILILDTEDVSTAVNVLRINVNGIGFSSSGVNGPFTTAWTLDGNFVADFITTGNLNASLITTGALNASLITTGALNADLITTGNINASLITTGALNASLITTGTLNGNNITVINLTATNVNLSGIFKAAVDANNYLLLDSASLQMVANGKNMMKIYNNSQQSIMNFYDTSGKRRMVLASQGNNQSAGIWILNASEGHAALWREDGFWFYNAAGDKNLAYFGTAIDNYNVQNGYIRLNRNSDSSIYSIITPYGLDCYYGGNHTVQIWGDSGIYTSMNLTVNGSKNRLVQTKDYDGRLLYAYETAEPYFGDIGESEIGADGSVYVQIDPVFAETVDLTEYQVFLTKYGQGDLWVEDRKNDHFTVKGTAGLHFGWEIKAKQFDHKDRRLEPYEVPEPNEKMR